MAEGDSTHFLVWAGTTTAGTAALAWGTNNRVLAGAAVGMLVLVPLINLISLAWRWWREGDHAYAVAALVVAVTASSGFLIGRWGIS